IQDDVLRLSGHEGFDVVNQLIRQNPHRSLAGPSDMRCHDEIWQIDSYSHIAVFRRLGAEDVETGTPDHTSLQCKRQSLLVHESASGRVDENGVTTHHGQLFRADHVASLLREGNMKGDDVAFLKNGEKVHEPWLRDDI